MFSKYIIPITIILCSSFQLTAQSGWAQEKGSFYTQTAISYYSSSDYYGTDGTLFDQGSTFSNYTWSLYGEYGFTSQLTAIADLPILRVNQFSTTESVAGIGDLRLGLKYQLLKNIPIAFSVVAEVPTNDGVNFAFAKENNELGIREQINLPTSDGEFNVWTTLAFSQSFAHGKGYGSVYGQVNFRTQNFSNQLKIGGEIGYKIIPELYLMGRIAIQEKLSEEAVSGASFLYGEGTTFTTIGLGAFYELNENLRIVASVAGYNDWLTDLKNIYRGNTFSLGIALEM